MTFFDREIVNILGLEGTTIYNPPARVRIGTIPSIFISSSTTINYSDDENERNTVTIQGKYPVDITYDTNHVFVYIDIIEYQHVADTKAPLLRVFDRKVRFQYGAIQQSEPQTTIEFRDLQFKKLMLSNIQSIKVELRTESGKLVPFFGSGRTILTLKFKKVS